MKKRSVANVLLADSDPASRLAIKTLLSTAGYAVDGAASASEAIGQLDANEYQLVLADLRAESDESGARLLAYARQKEFRPATSLISSKMCEHGTSEATEASGDRLVTISYENVSNLLAEVAELIGNRAERRMRQLVRQAV